MNSPRTKLHPEGFRNKPRHIPIFHRDKSDAMRLRCELSQTLVALSSFLANAPQKIDTFVLLCTDLKDNKIWMEQA